MVLFFRTFYLHALMHFLVTPCDNSKHGSFKDNFNYHMSTNRTCVECTLGEACSLWVNFWSPLIFKLQQNLKAMDTAIWLHNFIICHEMGIINRSISSKGADFEDDYLKLIASNPNESTDIFKDQVNVENAGQGISDNFQVRELKMKGKVFRNGIKTKIMSIGTCRPDFIWFRCKSGRIKMD